MVTAIKDDVKYSPPACQSDYQHWIKTGHNPTEGKKPGVIKMSMLRTMPFLCHYIEGWVDFANKILNSPKP